ncbi:ABC transporter permease [Sanguibacter hominis ATCC BAA-789]|uniref:ABC transporter permease n=1 Tax=Sanguibacter hominis ATCC BAA-789 TaxID=1312740 RepID=A0A9X5ISA8_9MICO|nr:ABC transporter permease [Sanguibacter hominis]NKX93919.1 ABC transporter permease [Sanguibacter hominis ATCC BAA-789]
MSDTVAFADPPTLGRRQVLTAEAVRPPLRQRLSGGALRAARSSAAILAFLSLWEVAPRVGLVDPVFLPSLSTVLAAFGELATSGELTKHVTASLGRAGVGFGIALATSIPVGIAIGWYRPVAELLTPILELFRNTAALALLPVFILILGIGETSKIALVVYACSFPILLTTISGVRTVDPLLVKSARSLGLPPVPLFWHVVLPAAVPTIFTGVRMAGSASILVLIAAEMIGAKAGLGFLITYTQYNFQIPEMYAGIIVIALTGLAINGVLLTIERRLSRWRTA